MQLISLTEAIDINTKMSDIDIHQPLDNKSVANGQLEPKIDTKVDNVKTVAGSGDSQQSAESITLTSKNGKIDETEVIEDFTQNDPTGINKCSEDKNITLPLEDEKSSEESIIEETNDSDITLGGSLSNKSESQQVCKKHSVKNLFENGAEKKTEESIDEETNDSDITLGGSVANKTESQNSAQIRDKNLFENGEENKSVENFGECISSQTKNTSVINELDNRQMPEDEHEKRSLSETEIKDKKEPEGSHIEKVISVKENLEKTRPYFKSIGENISELEYFHKETTLNTAQGESKLIEDKPKGINEISSSETDNNMANSRVQSMEQDPTSEMMANENPPRETTSDTITAEENFDKNKFNPMEQKCSSQEKSSFNVNHDNEFILQKNTSEAVGLEKNGDEVLLPEDNPMEQDPLPDADSLIITKDVKTILQKKNDKFAVKDISVENTLLPEEEPMEQENTSQIDVFDSSMKEPENMEKETEPSEDENVDNISETNETELQSTSTTDKTASPQTLETILQKKIKVSDNFAVKENSVETTLLTEDEPMEQENISQKYVVNDSMKEAEIIKKATESSQVDNGDNISESNETQLQSTSTDKSASQETATTILQKNNEVSDNFAVNDNSVENTLLPENEPMEQENISQIDVVDNTMKEAEIMKKETESSEHDNGDNVSETNEAEHKSTLTSDKTAIPETVSGNVTNELNTTTNNKLDWVVTNDSVERNKEIQIACFEQERTFEEIKVDATSDDNCTESTMKAISVLTVKSPTEINETLAAEIDADKKTNDVGTTESSEKEQILEEKNDLGISDRPVEVQSTERIATDKGDEIALKSKVSEELNDKMETSLKSKVHQDSNEKMETEANEIENLISNTNIEEQSSADQNDIPKQNEDTKVESSGKTEEVLDDAFALNDSDEECDIIKSKDKNKSPSKTEEILDTIIACMEVDRGDKKRLVEMDKLDITVNKTDIPQKPEVTTKLLCNLSNTLDILSDDDDNEPEKKIDKTIDVNESSQNSINIDDDDDVMLINEETCSKDCIVETSVTKTEETCITNAAEESKEDAGEKGIDTKNKEINKIYKTDLSIEKEPEAAQDIEIPAIEKPDIREILVESSEVIKKVEEKPKPLVPENFLKSFKTNVADMTREDLEDLCLQAIVEAVVDRSNFSEIKTKLKTMSSNMEEWRKKTMILTKQNRDLQIVLKTVQEEQKKKSDGTIVPLKITRSVGMQVYMSENERGIKRKNPNQTPPNNRNTKNAPNISSRQQQKSNAQIPVPRLIPATSNSPAKNTRPTTPQVQNTTVTSNSGVKTSSPHALPSGVRNSPLVKPAEKRPFSSVQSVTVDLTDDEPPPKQQVTARNAPQPPVRLVAQNQLLSARAQNQNNGPRKVYIPINSQNQAIRPGQTIMLKSVPPGVGPRPRSIRPMVTIPSNSPVRLPRLTSNLRHPAPLPDVAKQQQPPNWKALPPAPDLKISKVENGIVISWKIEGYQEDSYEQIASYQLYAYQETSTPPSTLLWKKIGDVKALALPMACTLTQFMAGYKYYFAVRAIDVRSRIGPFSLPGSILLLNK